jgi:hypothetical protein
VLCAAAVGLLFWRDLLGLVLYIPEIDGLFVVLHADPLLVQALSEQNALLAGKSPDWTANQDRLWLTERFCGGGPLQRAVLEKPSSKRLRDVIQESGGLVSHALLMDAKGRIAAEAFPSYNFDQARKPKFYYTFRRGPGARDVSWLQSSSDGSHVVCWRSETMVDPASGAPTGVVALEVSFDKVGRIGCQEQPPHSQKERATNRVDLTTSPSESDR